MVGQRSRSLSTIVVPSNEDYKNIETWHDRSVYYRIPTGNNYLSWRYQTFLAQKALPWRHSLGSRSKLYEDYFPYLAHTTSYQNMGYPLARSSSVVSTTTVGPRGNLLITRTYSVPDLTSYYQTTDVDRPSYRYLYNPWAYYSDLDDYSYDRYRYYRSPYYYRYNYSTYPYSYYWPRYKSYLYDSDYPYYYRNYSSPYYRSYYRDFYLRSYRNPWSSFYTPNWYYYY
uniref:Uncharacterized protein n=1 Tax=Acrobeloides nanus TaxID=290746 RepID=A0A914DAK2_9BILA